jgi:hypothetical protein
MALLLFAAAGWMAYRRSAGRRGEREQVLLRLASEFPGLSVHRGALLGSDGLRGLVDGLHLRIEPEAHAAQETVEVAVWGNIDHGISVVEKQAWHPVKRLLAVEPVWETGDPDFDADVVVRGAALSLCAALDAETRAAWRTLVRAKATVQEGIARLTFDGVLVEDALQRGEVGRSDVLEGARRLVRGVQPLKISPRDVPRAIARNALRDPLVSVRLKSLKTLAEYFPSKPLTRTLAHAALRDAAPEMRVAAALVCRDDAARRMMRRQVAMQDVPGAWRAAALSALAELAAEEAVPLARACLGQGPIELRLAAIEVLAAQRDAESLGALCSLAGLDALAEACARALGVLGDPGAEGALLAILSRGPVTARVTAARALETLGSLRSVAPLLEQTEGLLTDAALKDACRSAVRAIQARAPDGDAGRLTVAQPIDAGGLSLHEGEGAVSLVPPKGKIR